MVEEVRWAQVGETHVAYLTRSVKRRPADVHGYEDLTLEDIPNAVLEVAGRCGWEHFGRLGATLVAGPNKAARLKAAAAAQRESGDLLPTRAPFQPCSTSTSGGLKISFENGLLNIEANEYCKGGVDPQSLLQELGAEIRPRQLGSFWVSLSLKGLWWSSCRQASECCGKVFAGIVALDGFEGFRGNMNLSENDLGDDFVDSLCGFLATGSTRLQCLILNKNGLTTNGACQLATLLGRVQARNVEMVELHSNPIDNIETVLQTAREACSGVNITVGPNWDEANGMRALSNKDTWSDYFTGPAQLIRTKLMASPGELSVVECPVCLGVVLKSDMQLEGGKPVYTVADNLLTHLRGDPHRRKLRAAIDSGRQLHELLVLTPSRSFLVDPLSGIHREGVMCRSAHCNASRPTQATSRTSCPRPHLILHDHEEAEIYLGANDEASAIRAIVWQEGRQALASNPETVSVAYELLRERSRCNVEREGQGHYEEVFVDQLSYTQDNCGARFKDGRKLETLIQDLDDGTVDPLKHPNLKLEVVRTQQKMYSNDNRRLYCLKQHQEHVKPRRVRVAIIVYDLPRAPAFQRFLDRITSELGELVLKGTGVRHP